MRPRGFPVIRAALSCESGFTLLELMIVCTVIGVLAMIAIPSYSKFALRARQMEAKTLLANLYTAEKSFWLEYLTYSTRLNAIGFAPAGRLRTNIGFSQDLVVYPAGTPLGNAACIQACPTTLCGESGWGCDNSAMNGMDGGVTCTATQFTFLAGTHVHWDGLVNTGPKSSWTINHFKVLTEVSNPN